MGRHYLDTHKDDENSEDYQNRIRQAKNRIAEIDSFIGKIGLKSSLRSQYLDLKSVDEILVSNLDSDAPFYDALAELHRQNQKEAKGRIRRNAAFLKANKGYLRCKKFWVSVREDLSNEVCRIQKECRGVVTNNSIDGTAISTGKKIERIKAQIKAYENARDEYVIGSIEYRDAEGSLKRLRETLAAAQKMNGCEMELNRIKESSYNGRLRALAKFKNENKEILTTEQEKEVEELKADALRHWQDYQSTNELRYAIKEDDALNVQKQKADELETVYSTLMEEMLPNSPHYTQFEQKKREFGDRKRAIEHDQKLVNAFRALPSTNAVERCQLLNAIDVFELTYHDDGSYKSKHAKDVFRQLDRVKAEAGRAFLSDFTNRIFQVQCPPETNFLGRFQWADACMKITEESYKGLNTNNAIRLSLEDKYKNYEIQLQRFVKLSDLAFLANEIIGKVPTNDVRVACDRLSEIKKFYSDYPAKANQDPLVGEYYSNVKKIREENECVVSRYIVEKLREMDEGLPYGASEEKKLEVWKKEIDLLGEYIPKLIEGTNPHTVYKQRLMDLTSRFSVAQRKGMFDQDRTKLLAEIKHEQDLGRKLQKINKFLETNHDVCLNDFARDKMIALTNEAERIEKEIEFNEYNDELNKIVEGKPEEDADESAFAKFKAQITSLRKRLDKFKQSPQLKSKCQSVDQKLQAQLDYVEKALGDGSWKAIQQKEEEYKKNPCEETEKKLRAALANFDEKRFGRYLDNKKEVENRFNKDIEYRSKVSSAKELFFANPSHSAFVEFKKAVDACILWENSYGCKWRFADECSTYISKIENGIQVDLKMESVNFSDSWKSVEITIVQEGVHIPDKFDYKLFKGGPMPESCSINVARSKGLYFKVKYKNYTAYDEASKRISFWELLKGGASSGEYSPWLIFSVEEEYSGTIQLSIQGIPCMP